MATLVDEHVPNQLWAIAFVLVACAFVCFNRL